MRKLTHQIARIIHLMKISPAVIKRSGGFYPTLRKALKHYRRNGIEGLKLGIRSAQQLHNAVLPDGISRTDYAEWVRRYDTMTDSKRSKMKAICAAFIRKPLISVIMPTYNSNHAWLVEAVNSVRAQIYDNWELCIADDASTDPAIKVLLKNIEASDARIKVTFREKNGHISAASNSALALASGEFIALLDHDDILSESALFWVVHSINEHPAAGLFYSDEDKIDSSGCRIWPYFKCDWNYNLFLSHNMVSHLGVYRKSLVDQLGGFRLGFEGSQDYDLALRCVEKLESLQIIHIPRILYHWRMHNNSTSVAEVEAKPYVFNAGRKAVKEHLFRTGVEAEIEHVKNIGFRVRFNLVDGNSLVSIIIPNRNAFHLINKCIDSIISKTDYQNYEIIVIDNGSDDTRVLQYLSGLAHKGVVRLIHDGSPFNYSSLNNKAVAIAKGDYICLMNNDIEVISAGWLREMLSIAQQPGVGAVGAKLLYPDGTVQHAGVVVGYGGVAGHAHKGINNDDPGYFGRANLTQCFSAVTAACLLVKKAAYQEINGLDAHLAVAFNDVDFCLRLLRAGYRNVWTPYALMFHHESATRGYEDNPEKINRFQGEINFMKNRWQSSLLKDPAYSPNLTLDNEDFSYAWPPRVELIE